MSEQRPEILNTLCAALELEAREKEFYEKAVDECPHEFGKEIFRMLLDDEKEHAKGIEDIYESLKSGHSWPTSCSLFDKKSKNARETIRIFADRYGNEIKSGATPSKALQIAVDLERASVRFYKDHMNAAKDPVEKKFLQKMVEEEQGHHLLLLDMQYYYEDPGGYFMEKEHRGLDGA